MRAVVEPYVTFADYLESERSSDIKHEWFDGAVYARSRGTPEHARLSARFLWLLRSALPADCEVYSSDLMLYVADVKLSTYADASVVCGPLETITVKRNGKSLGEAVTNPVVIVEVLSDSTERYDREEKFAYYRTLPSLKNLCSSRRTRSRSRCSGGRRRTTACRRDRRVSPGERWEAERAGPGGAVTIHGCTIAVDAVYGTRD